MLPPLHCLPCRPPVPIDATLVFKEADHQDALELLNKGDEIAQNVILGLETTVKQCDETTCRKKTELKHVEDGEAVTGDDVFYFGTKEERKGFEDADPPAASQASIKPDQEGVVPKERYVFCIGENTEASHVFYKDSYDDMLRASGREKRWATKDGNPRGILACPLCKVNRLHVQGDQLQETRDATEDSTTEETETEETAGLGRRPSRRNGFLLRRRVVQRPKEMMRAWRVVLIKRVVLM